MDGEGGREGGMDGWIHFGYGLIVFVSRLAFVCCVYINMFVCMCVCVCVCARMWCVCVLHVVVANY